MFSEILAFRFGSRAVGAGTRSSEEGCAVSRMERGFWWAGAPFSAFIPDVVIRICRRVCLQLRGPLVPPYSTGQKRHGDSLMRIRRYSI